MAAGWLLNIRLLHIFTDNPHAIHTQPRTAITLHGNNFRFSFAAWRSWKESNYSSFFFAPEIVSKLLCQEFTCISVQIWLRNSSFVIARRRCHLNFSIVENFRLSRAFAANPTKYSIKMCRFTFCRAFSAESRAKRANFGGQFFSFRFQQKWRLLCFVTSLMNATSFNMLKRPNNLPDLLTATAVRVKYFREFSPESTSRLCAAQRLSMFEARNLA